MGGQICKQESQVKIHNSVYDEIGRGAKMTGKVRIQKTGEGKSRCRQSIIGKAMNTRNRKTEQRAKLANTNRGIQKGLEIA